MYKYTPCVCPKRRGRPFGHTKEDKIQKSISPFAWQDINLMWVLMIVGKR